jgi:hypothetical protein
MNDLPEELITEILLKLSIRSLIHPMTISKLFAKLVRCIYVVQPMQYRCFVRKCCNFYEPLYDGYMPLPDEQVGIQYGVCL